MYEAEEGRRQRLRRAVDHKAVSQGRGGHHVEGDAHTNGVESVRHRSGHLPLVEQEAHPGYHNIRGLTTMQSMGYVVDPAFQEAADVGLTEPGRGQCPPPA